MSSHPRLIEVQEGFLKQNDLLARALREEFRAAGVFVTSLVSSPGSGKTKFLQELLHRFAPEIRIAVLAADPATENDANRLAASARQVRQITTGSISHLEALMVEKAIYGWTLTDIDFLFIENVGNLVSPSSYDLGEQLRVVLFSSTEGEDKPLKYPTIFDTADLAIITKMDLAEAAEFDLAAARRNIQIVRPGIQIFEISAKRGDGMAEVVSFLLKQRDELLHSKIAS